MFAQLTKLIGHRFLYKGEVWIMVEILRQEDALVIVPEQKAHAKQIQVNQYGHANRRCDACTTLRLTNTEGDGYSESVLELLSGKLPE